MIRPERYAKKRNAGHIYRTSARAAFHDSGAASPVVVSLDSSSPASESDDRALRAAVTIFIPSFTTAWHRRAHTPCSLVADFLRSLKESV